jgi:hypothetical protein
MPDPTSPFDPYASPVTSAQRLGSYRPGGLTALCILAILLGALGLFTALFSGVSIVAGRQLQEMLTFRQPGQTPEAAKLQREMNDKTMDVVDEFRVYNVLAVLVHLVVTTSLLVGAVMTLRLNPTGRRVLHAACWLAILFELGRGILQTFMQLKNFAIMREYMPRVMSSAGQGGAPRPGAEQIAETMTNMIIYFSLGFMAIFILLKVIYYVITIVYLRKPKIRGLFASSASERLT